MEVFEGKGREVNLVEVNEEDNPKTMFKTTSESFFSLL